MKSESGEEIVVPVIAKLRNDGSTEWRQGVKVTWLGKVVNTGKFFAFSFNQLEVEADDILLGDSYPSEVRA
jgi:hypothetical protein